MNEMERRMSIVARAPITRNESQTERTQWNFEGLIKTIKEFESTLDEEKEVGARLVSFGETYTFHIVNIKRSGPDLLIFSGIDTNGQNMQLVQHLTQLSVLLVAMKKFGEKPNRIGFQLEEEDKE